VISAEKKQRHAGGLSPGVLAPLLAFAALSCACFALAGTLSHPVFTDYSPLSTNLELARRSLSPLTAAQLPRILTQSGTRLSEQPIDLSQETFVLYVPSPAPPQGYALLVFERWKQCSGRQGLTQTSWPPAEQLSKASCWRNCSRSNRTLQPARAPQHGNPSRKSTGASADWQRRAASSWRERSSCCQSEHAVSSAQLLKRGVARVARSGRLALLVHGHPDGKVPGIADADE